jgi:hypothetical protein
MPIYCQGIISKNHDVSSPLTSHQLRGTYWPPKTITYLMMKTPMEANMAAINSKRCDFRVFLKTIMREGTIFPKTLSTQI